MTTFEGTASEYTQRLRDDFLFFAEQMWWILGLDKHAPMSWVERDICGFVSGQQPNLPSDRGVLAPRGVGKSHIVMVYVDWLLYRDPDIKIMLVSQSAGRADQMAKYIRQTFENVPWLRHLKPREGQVDAAGKFQVGPAKDSNQPSVVSLGVDGMLEGNRAHFIIGDDVETDTNTLTLEARDKLDHRVKELRAILYPAKPNQPTGIVYVGTYHHEDSLYLKLGKRGYYFRTWPLVYPEKGDVHLNLAPDIAERLAADPSLMGSPTMPHRFGEEYCAKQRAEGATYFAMQQKLLSNLAASGRYSLSLANLMVDVVDPVMAPNYTSYGVRDHNGSTCIDTIQVDSPTASDRLHRPAFVSGERFAYMASKGFVDPAGVGSDLTACCAVGVLNGIYYVKGLRGFRGGVDSEALDDVAKFFFQLHVAQIAYECNIDAFDVFGPALQIACNKYRREVGQDHAYPQGYFPKVEPTRSKGQKEVRIVGVLEPLVSTRRVVVDYGVVTPVDGLERHHQFQYQFSRITKERRCLKHDDVIDAFAGAIGLFIDHAKVTPDKAAARTLDANVREALESFSGVRRAKPRWIES